MYNGLDFKDEDIMIWPHSLTVTTNQFGNYKTCEKIRYGPSVFRTRYYTYEGLLREEIYHNRIKIPDPVWKQTKYYGNGQLELIVEYDEQRFFHGRRQRFREDGTSRVNEVYNHGVRVAPEYYKHPFECDRVFRACAIARYYRGEEPVEEPAIPAPTPFIDITEPDNEFLEL